MVGAFAERIHQKAHGGDHRHMNGTVYQGNRRAEGRCVKMITGYQQADDIKEFCHLPGKFPGGRFFIQFFDDLLGLGFQFLLGLPV